MAAVMAVALFAATAFAFDESALLNASKYTNDFIARTQADVKTITETMDKTFYDIQGKKLEGEESDAVLQMYMDTFELRGAVDLAQDVMLASAVELGIAYETGKKPVVYEDAVKRFPDGILEMTKRISRGLSASGNPMLVSAWKAMKPSMEDLEAALADWPGDSLRRVMQDEQRGTGDLPPDVVKLAEGVDKVAEVAGKYAALIAQDVDRATAVNRPYGQQMRITIRNANVLSISAYDIVMLITAAQRIKLHASSLNMAESGAELVAYHLGYRMAWYEDMLVRMEKQCEALTENQKYACGKVTKNFRLALAQFRGYGKPVNTVQQEARQ